MNLLEPPFIPARDKTHRFSEFVDGPTLDDLLKLQVINSKDSLYDFSFYHNYINQSSDGYHPTDKCTLDWTDNILLPALAKQGLICST
jgi:hypothetical protein